MKKWYDDEDDTLIEKITNWWWYNIGWKIRDIYRSIRNVIRWIPIIWKDRDWDDSYIFTILQTKLKFQSKYIGKRDIHTRAKRNSEVMNLCVNLIEKVKDEYYDMEYIDYFETKYDFVDCDTPGYKRMEFTEISENADEYFKKYPLIHKRVLNGEGWLSIIDEDTGEVNKKRIAMNMAQINHNRARKLLFNIMSDEIEKWWD
jgi:hypothetical protein